MGMFAKRERKDVQVRMWLKSLSALFVMNQSLVGVWGTMCGVCWDSMQAGVGAMGYYTAGPIVANNNQGCSSYISHKVIVEAESLDKSEFLSIKEYLQSLSARCVVISDLSISGFDVSAELDLKLQDKGTLDLGKYSCLFKEGMEVSLANLNMPDSSFSFYEDTCQRTLMLHKFASNTFSKKKGSVKRTYNFWGPYSSLDGRELIFDPSKKERYKRETWKDQDQRESLSVSDQLLGTNDDSDSFLPTTLEGSCQGEMRSFIATIENEVRRDMQGEKKDACWLKTSDLVLKDVKKYKKVVDNIYEEDKNRVGYEKVDYEKVREARIMLEVMSSQATGICKPEFNPTNQDSDSSPTVQ